MDYEDFFNKNSGKSDADIKSFLRNYACEDNNELKNLSDLVENINTKKLDKYGTLGNIRTLSDYRSTESILKENGRVTINKGLKGISNLLYDSLDRFIGLNKELYSSTTSKDQFNQNIKTLGNTLEGSEFNIFNYSRMVELVQNKNINFVNNGNLGEQKYSLELGDNTLRLEPDKTEKYVNVEITNRKSESLKFKINKEGEIFADPNNSYEKPVALKILEAYKPFLLELNENHGSAPSASGGYERTKTYIPPRDAPAVAPRMAMTYR